MDQNDDEFLEVLVKYAQVMMARWAFADVHETCIRDWLLHRPDRRQQVAEEWLRDHRVNGRVN